MALVKRLTDKTAKKIAQDLIADNLCNGIWLPEDGSGCNEMQFGNLAEYTHYVDIYRRGCSYKKYKFYKPTYLPQDDYLGCLFKYTTENMADYDPEMVFHFPAKKVNDTPPNPLYGEKDYILINKPVFYDPEKTVGEQCIAMPAQQFYDQYKGFIRTACFSDDQGKIKLIGNLGTEGNYYSPLMGYKRIVEGQPRSTVINPNCSYNIKNNYVPLVTCQYADDILTDPPAMLDVLGYYLMGGCVLSGSSRAQLNHFGQYFNVDEPTKSKALVITQFKIGYKKYKTIDDVLNDKMDSFNTFSTNNALCGVPPQRTDRTWFYSDTYLIYTKEYLGEIMSMLELPYALDLNTVRNDKIDELPDYNPPEPEPPVPPLPPDPDPWNPDPSKPGGGDGDRDDTSDNIELPVLPNLGASTTGMLNLFNPTNTELNDLAEYLWTPDFTEAIAKLVTDPMDGLISLNMVPVKIPGIEAKKEVKVGFIGTNVMMNVIPQQFVTVDCGTLDINPYWGNYLDYNPYTKIQIFLPFIGFVDLDTDDIMGGKLHIIYYVDLLTGTCQCFIIVKRKNLNSILYTYSGNCATQIPLTGNSYNAVIQALATTVANDLSSGVIGSEPSDNIGEGILSNASGIIRSKSQIQRGGSISASGALMSYKKPYLVITRPKQSHPKFYSAYRGYPSNITAVLENLHGFTQVEEVHLEGLTEATTAELDMIESALKEGVLL